MITVDPANIELPKLHSLLQSSVSPRPIALASTVNKDGIINLSPFSFFNVFSSHPPILVFSPSRRGRNNTTKHTYENVLEVPEVVINIVSYSMVEQVSLASVEYPQGVNEFLKAGLTPVTSVKVKPLRVGESPISFECKVNQVLPLGDLGGAGNLLICEIILAHFKEEIFDSQGRIDPQKVDAVARMGNDFYCRVHGESIFEVPKPTDKQAIGFDQIPESIRNSHVLTGNDLGRLGSSETLPPVNTWHEALLDPEYESASKIGEDEIHKLAQKRIREGKTETAWKILLQYTSR